MFQAACAIYEPCLVQVGGPTSGGGATLHGTGCLLSPVHFITALHVVKDATARYGGIAVAKYDGLYKAKLLASCPKCDVAVLEAIDKLDTSSLKKPGTWPAFKENHAFARGMTVGYMSFLRKADAAGKPSTFTFFSAAHVSFLGRDEHNNPRWVLSGGFSESGFSGSPVFLPDGTLVGVSVSTLLMNAEVEDCPFVPHCFPQVSAIPPVGKAVVDEINRRRQAG
jgi:hypothetical protein